MIIGLDVGGTHTDVVLLGNEGVVNEIKVPTLPSDLFNTILAGIEKITANVNPENIRRAVLSTTLTTNAIVQQNTPTVGMIVSGGPGIDPELYRTNEHYYTVSGSIDHRGRVRAPVDPREIKEIVKRFQENGIQHVGIAGKFSTRNPDHELKIEEIVRVCVEKVFLGHRISGNLNFPRRIATTFLNAAVYPIHKAFFAAVQKTLRQKGLNVPIHILKADGGTMNFESSIDFPGQTILSGPAASVMGSMAFAPSEEDALVMDIGGTTTDMAILINRTPLLDPLGIEIGDYKTLIRSLKTHSIGLGGDSAVRVRDGHLTIGPDRQGPAMAHGGPAPTPTDALLIMGKLISGDKDKSVDGFKPIARELGLSIEDAACKVFDQACRTILKEAREMIARINSKPVYTVHELYEGYKVTPEILLVIGGPAPYFAKHLEEISDFRVGVVPRWKVANAIGAALARTTCEVTLFADTEQAIATAPEENFSQTVDKLFSQEAAVAKAYELLKQKALHMGASADDLDMEVVENLQFNMVRGFYTTGKNIRVKVQVKPGLMHEYDAIADKLSDEA